VTQRSGLRILSVPMNPCMFWTVRGVNAIVALRCHRISNKFEDYWASRSRAA
jgi:hypothetical protein